MDPIGLALENFDAVGAFRETDQGAPIETGGDLDGAQFTGPVELSKALRASPDAAKCVVRMLYAYTTGHLPEDSELPSVEALSADFAANEHRLQKTVLAMTKSDSFRYVSAPR